MATGSNNAYRLSKLLLDGGTFFARELLLKLIVERLGFTTIDSFLNSPPIRTIIRGLQNRKILKKDQIDILYPQINSVEIEKLDITLLTCVLINCCQLTIVETTVVQKLREFRNTLYGHSPAFAIDEILFHQKWKEISAFLQQETKSNLKPQCEKTIEILIKCAESEVITQNMGEKYIEELLAWHKEQLEVLGSIAELRTDVKHLKEIVVGQSTEKDKDDKNVGLKIRKRIESQINKANIEVKRVKDMNEKTLIENRPTIPKDTLEYLLNILNNERVLILKGLSGSGKSFLGKSIMAEKVEDGYEPIILKDLQDLRAVQDDGRSLVFLINIKEQERDILNQHAETFLYCILKKQFIFIFTVRLNVLNVKVSSTFLGSILEMRTFQVNDSTFNKENILRYYSGQKGIRLSTDIIKKLCTVEVAAVGFPILCKHMQGEEKEIESLFKRPIQFISTVIDAYFTRKSTESLVLLLTLLNKNRLKRAICENNKDFLAELRTVYNIDTVTEEQLLNSAETLVGTFLQQVENSFNILHDYILEAVFNTAMRHIPRYVISNSPIEYIVDFATLYLEETFWDCLLHRFESELDKSHIAKCSLWNSYDFINFVLVEHRDQIFFAKSIRESGTLFEYLCANVSSGIIEIILFRSDFNLRNSNKEILSNAMLEACKAGKIDILRPFISVAGFPITDELIFSAIESSNVVAMMEYLIQNGGNINARTAKGENLVQYAGRVDMFDVIKYLEVQHPVKFEQLLEETDDETKLKCLLVLDLRKHISNFVKKYLESDINLFGKRHLLHIAAEIGNVGCLRIISQKFVGDLRTIDEHGFNALHYATAANRKKNMQHLIRKGISPESETNDGLNILHIAAFLGYSELVEFISQKYTRLLHKTDFYGWKPLHISTISHSIKCIEILLKATNDPNCCTSDGDNILHLAVKHNHIVLVNYILKHHIELIYQRDGDGRNVHDLAEENQKMKRLLSKYNAKHAKIIDDISVYSEETSSSYSNKFHRHKRPEPYIPNSLLRHRQKNKRVLHQISETGEKILPGGLSTHCCSIQ